MLSTDVHIRFWEESPVKKIERADSLLCHNLFSSKIRNNRSLMDCNFYKYGPEL